MTGYTPEQLPVTSALARGFATFDHWFCACAALATHLGKLNPELSQDEDITRANGAALLSDLVGDVFVRLHGG